MAQLMYEVPYRVEELPDMAAAQITETDLPVIAQMGSWVQARQYDMQSTMYLFRDLGAEPKVLVAIIGDKIWTRIFPQAPTPDDVLPVQVRILLALQISKLAARLEAPEFEEAKRNGTKGAQAAAEEAATRKTYKVHKSGRFTKKKHTAADMPLPDDVEDEI
jgi:hypothetical protein